MKALIVVDIQKDFLPGGSLAVPDGDSVIPVINKLQKKFELVVATQDWHPPDHGSFASNHPGKEVFQRIELHGQDQLLWPDHCVQGTSGSDFADSLQQEKIEAIFRKGMEVDIDSYSAFYDNGHRKATGLGSYLLGRKVDELYVVGLAGDVCVYFTVIDALQEGFTTYLIQDATRAVNMHADDFTAALVKMREKGAHIVASSMFLSAPHSRKAK